MTTGHGSYGPFGHEQAGDVHETVGAYALGILDDIEASAFEAHLATCERCARNLEEFAGMEPMLAALADLPAERGAPREPTPQIGDSSRPARAPASRSPSPTNWGAAARRSAGAASTWSRPPRP